jgi:hypothetical protein
VEISGHSWDPLSWKNTKEESAADLSCPKCGSSDTRRSHSRGTRSAVERILGRYPLRCRSCRARFFRIRTAHRSMRSEHTSPLT